MLISNTVITNLLRQASAILSLQFKALSPISVHSITSRKYIYNRNEVRCFSKLIEKSSYSEESSVCNKELREFNKEEECETRLLKVAIIGVPNAGKSTVINQLVGRRVCSTSTKVHTTRCKARAIAIHGNTQIVFLDTPGLVTSSECQRHHLEHEFHSDSELAMLEADVIGVVHDVSNHWTRHRLDPKVLRLLHLYPRKHSFLMLNKIDTMKSKRKLLDIIRTLTKNTLGKQVTSSAKVDSEIFYYENTQRQPTKKMNLNDKTVENEISDQLSELQLQKKLVEEKGWAHFREVFMISALNGNGTADVQEYLLHISEPSPWLYPQTQFTDQPSETVVLDTVRSKLLDYLPQEIPYNLSIAMEYFDYGAEGSFDSPKKRVSQVDLEVSIEAEQVINVLNHTSHKIQLALCLPMLVKNKEELLQPYLTEEELSFVLSACEPYVSKCPESRSFSGESEEQLEETSEEEIRESSSDFRKVHSSEIVFEERQDVVMWKALKLLFGKPAIRSLVKNLVRELLPAGAAFLHYFKEFQNYSVENLSTSFREQQTKKENLRRLWNQNENNRQKIENLSKLLDEEEEGGLKLKITAENLRIRTNKGTIERLNRKCKDDIRRRVYESERAMILHLKDSKIRQESAITEITELENKLESLLKSNLKEEKELRGRKLKVETQLLSWLSKYDADIGEKQAEYDEIMAGFNEEKKQMEELQEQFDIQNEEYTRLMQEKEDEEQAIFEERMYQFLCNRSARRIQRCWRAYRERKIARRKARKKRKGGKKKGTGKK